MIFHIQKYLPHCYSENEFNGTGVTPDVPIFFNGGSIFSLNNYNMFRIKMLLGEDPVKIT